MFQIYCQLLLTKTTTTVSFEDSLVNHLALLVLLPSHPVLVNRKYGKSTRQYGHYKWHWIHLLSSMLNYNLRQCKTDIKYWPTSSSFDHPMDLLLPHYNFTFWSMLSSPSAFLPCGVKFSAWMHSEFWIHVICLFAADHECCIVILKAHLRRLSKASILLKVLCYNYLVKLKIANLTVCTQCKHLYYQPSHQQIRQFNPNHHYCTVLTASSSSSLNWPT